MNISISSGAVRVLNTLEEAGFEAYVVGECVRDSILGRKPFGWDVTTNATLEDLKTVLPEAEVFSEKFGVVRLEYIEEAKVEGEVVEVGVIVDVAPYRKEAKYVEGLLVDSTRAETIEDDLSHRDFTINAIAENHTSLADAFEGKEDIRKKLVKTVGDADRVFKEDPICIENYIKLDDNDIWTSLKIWCEHEDAILSTLSKGIINRNLFKVEVSEKPISKE